MAGNPAELYYYDQAPMRARPSDHLATEYGYADISSFAAALPERAEVADIGAGLSSLGAQVCERRDDVRWVNVDIQYGNFGNQADEDAYRYLVEHKPANLTYEAADALKLVEVFGSEQFDRVFSYWMLPHIILDGRDLGAAAAENMLKVTKPSGKVAVGPVHGPQHNGQALGRHTREVVPAADEAAIKLQADEMVVANAMKRVPALIERFFRKRAYAKRIAPVS